MGHYPLPGVAASAIYGTCRPNQMKPLQFTAGTGRAPSGAIATGRYADTSVIAESGLRTE